ncbi:hypothetical protein, partial [Bacteroides salyersiae]|uniref:hypothetical protein n=1 Tax=Bacteroides salyersiae TaxID=291644 RepID=UPI001960EB35
MSLSYSLQTTIHLKKREHDCSIVTQALVTNDTIISANGIFDSNIMQSYKYSDKKEKNNDIFSWLQNKHHIKKRKHSGKHISDETEKRLFLLFFSVRECRRYIK